MAEETKKIIQKIEENKRLARMIDREIKSTFLISEAASPGNHTEVYNTFVKPFGDILRAAKLTGMGITNSIRLTWGLVNAYDADEMEEALEEFNDRKQRIDKDWEPILQRAEELNTRGDPLLKMAVWGPGLFLSAKGFGAGLASGKTIAEVLSARDWNYISKKYGNKFNPNENLVKNSKEIQTMQKKLLRKLSRLFLVRSRAGGVDYDLDEGDEPDIDTAEDNQIDEKLSPEEAVNRFMEITGMDVDLAKSKILLCQNILETVNRMKKTIIPLSYGAEILAVQDLDQLESIIKEIKNKGAKIEIPIEKMRKEMDREAQTLVKDEKFQNKITNSGSKKVTPEEILKAAEKIVFNNGKEQLNQQIMKQLSSSLPEIEKSISSLAITKDILEIMHKDDLPIVKRAAKVYEDFIKSYKEIKAKLQSQVS